MQYKDQKQSNKPFHRDYIISRDARSLIRFDSAFGLCQQECVLWNIRNTYFIMGNFNTSEKYLSFMDINTFNFQT